MDSLADYLKVSSPSVCLSSLPTGEEVLEVAVFALDDSPREGGGGVKDI